MKKLDKHHSGTCSGTLKEPVQKLLKKQFRTGTHNEPVLEPIMNQSKNPSFTSI